MALLSHVNIIPQMKNGSVEPYVSESRPVPTGDRVTFYRLLVKSFLLLYLFCVYLSNVLCCLYMKKIRQKGCPGRPSTFKKEYIDEMYKFFNGPIERREVIKSMIEYDEQGNEKKKAEEVKILPAKFPSLYAFSRHIGVPFGTVSDWAEYSVDRKLEQRKKKIANGGVVSKKDIILQQHLNTFSVAYQEAKQAQKDFLINNGLSGASNAAFSIFTAKNVTDMRDKIETEVSHRMVSPLLENLSLDTITEALPNPQKKLED